MTDSSQSSVIDFSAKSSLSHHLTQSTQHWHNADKICPPPPRPDPLPTFQGLASGTELKHPLWTQSKSPSGWEPAKLQRGFGSSNAATCIMAPLQASGTRCCWSADQRPKNGWTVGGEGRAAGAPQRTVHPGLF